MNSDSNAFTQYLQLRGKDSAAATGVQETLNRRAADALAAIASHPDSDIFAPDYGVNLGHLPMQADLATSFRCGVPQLNSLLAVVANDVFYPTENLYRNAPEGLYAGSIRTLPEQFAADAASMLETGISDSDAPALVNSLLLHDGVYIRVEKGAEVEKPVQIVNIFNSDIPMLTPRRVLIHAMAGSRIRVLLCDHSQTPATAHLNSQIVQVKVEADASVELYDIEESSAATTRYWQLFAEQADGSHLTVNTCYLTGGRTVNTYRISCGNNTDTSLSGLVIASGTENVTNRVDLRHTGTGATSKQLFKSALFDKSRGTFKGNIYVAEGAARTDASQSCRNLLASADARMVSEPQLEIYCDDVKCSHGATTGQLDERALFYMQTRGVPVEEARNMLTQAFMADVIDNISFEVLRQRMHMLVEKRLSGATADCSSCAAACHAQSTE